MADTYANYAELAANQVEGTDYQIITRYIGSDTTCMTPHGGGIEPGSSEVVEEVAGYRYNMYKFEGIKSSGNSVLHITSANFDEPKCLTMSAKSKRVISIHGKSGDTAITYVGGLDKALCQSVFYHLRKAGFTVEFATGSIGGINPDNFINKNIRGMGCQLELTTQQRKSFFTNDDYSSANRVNKTETFYNYANAIKAALSESRERRIDSDTTVKMNFKGNLENGSGVIGKNYVTTSKLDQNSDSIVSTVSAGYSSAIDKINIGGTNLIGNSAPTSLSGWLASDNWELSLVECPTAPFNYAVRSTNINNAVNGGLTKVPIDKYKLVNNENYTMSGWVRASKPCKVRFSNLMMIDYENFVDVTTNWQYFSYTGKVDTNSILYANSLLVHSSTCENGMWIETHSFKLERGTKATDWSCAREDLEDSISKVEQTANKINWLVKSGTSMSNMALTDSMLELTSRYVLVNARKIELNGSININEGLFRVLTNGNTKIGGESGYNIEGYDRAKFEITSNGTLFSTSTEKDQFYTKISEGYIKCNNSADEYTIIDGTQVRATNISADKITPRTKITLTLSNNNGCDLILRTLSSTGESYFNPTSNGSVRLGSSSYKWHSIWTTATSLNSTSDIRFKKDITPIDEKIENMFMDLEPVNYRKKMHDDGRLHNGFIAQQVEEAMTKNNVSYDEFSGLVKTDIEAGSDLMLVSDETIYNKNDKEYSLAYGEFTALNTHMIQKLYKRIEELEERIKKLEGE